MISSPIKRLSVVVPCFNESGNIKRFKRELFPVFEACAFTTEYIFVDDGSTDDTLLELKKLSSRGATVEIVCHPENRGLGASVIDGLKMAKGDALLTLDADLTFHPQEFGVLLRRYREGFDCVLGSPLRGVMEGVPLLRKLLSHSVNGVYRLLWGRQISSTSSIFRLYRTSVLQSLQLHRQSFDINAEIVLKLLQSGKKLCEVPVTLSKRQWGASKINTVREIKNHLRLFGAIVKWKVFGKV